MNCNDKNAKNIVYAVDENYLKHSLVSLLSFVKNNPGSSCKVHIIHNGIPIHYFGLFKLLDEVYDICINTIYIDDSHFNAFPKRFHFSNANYYRLMIPDLIDENRVLYLDADTIVKGSIDPLYFHDLDGYPIGAVEDLDFRRHGDLLTMLKMDKQSKYFNSGVMILDLENWRKIGLHRKVMDFISDEPHRILLADQCGLNSIINGNWKQLDLKFNVQSVVFSGKYSTQNELEPVIIHFTDTPKPWDSGSQHPFVHLYNMYLEEINNLLDYAN